MVVAVKECPEAVEVEDIDAVAGRKSMLASAVFVIALSIKNLVNANIVTQNEEASAVDMRSI